MTEPANKAEIDAFLRDAERMLPKLLEGQALVCLAVCKTETGQVTAPLVLANNLKRAVLVQALVELLYGIFEGKTPRQLTPGEASVYLSWMVADIIESPLAHDLRAAVDTLC